MKRFSNPKMLLELAFIKLVDENNMIENSEETPISQQIENKNVKETLDTKEKTGETINENKQNITREIKNNIKKEKNNDIIQELNDFIDIRINNTLAKFSKKNTLELKEQLKKTIDYVMDEKYNIYATMILDGELKAVSDEYAIFTYATTHLSTLFNENIINIENLIDEILKKHYKVVAVDQEKWNIIKENFNSKKKKFEYQEENNNIDEILKKLNKDNIDDMQSLFGEIVEYN